MKTNQKKNRGVKMNIADVKAMIMTKEEQLVKQCDHAERLKQTITNTCNDIEQLKCTLKQMECAEGKPRRVVPRERMAYFFIIVCRLFERLQHRVHRMLNYSWFCLSLCARYEFQSHSPNPARRLLSPCTVLGYFKRERGMGLS